LGVQGFGLSSRTDVDGRVFVPVVDATAFGADPLANGKRQLLNDVLLMVAVLFFLSMVAVVGVADESPPARRTLPTVASRQLDGVTVKCLDAQQWQDVLVLANEYQGLFNWRLQTEAVLRAQAAIDQAYQLKIDNYAAMVRVLEADRKFLNDELARRDAATARVQLGERLERYGLWVLVLAETITIGVLGTRSWVLAK
jgi:hypothetical protein